MINEDDDCDADVRKQQLIDAALAWHAAYLKICYLRAQMRYEEARILHGCTICELEEDLSEACHALKADGV